MIFGRLAGVLLGVALIAASASAHAAPPPDPPMWRVTDGDTEMILFGAMHDLPPDLEWRTPALDVALDRADLVVFESLADDSAASRAVWVAFQGLMIAETPLNVALSPELYERVRRAAAEADIPLADLDPLRPWAVAMALDAATLPPEEGEGDALALAGADMVIETSLPVGRRREALDTPRLLETAFASLSQAAPGEGQGLLGEILDDMPGRTLDLTTQIAWADGDTAPMIAELDQLRTDAPVLYAAMFDARNRAWMEALTRMMRTERRVVVVVGAGHMIGDVGLPTLLRQAGFTVEGP